jgi:hypothetical protein
MNSIEKYFTDDRLQLGIGIIISVFSLIIAAFLYMLKRPAFAGMSYSIIPLTLILLSVCVFLFIRTPKDLKRVSTFYQTTPEKMKTEELPRMEKVLKNFNWIIKTEICIIIAGVFLFVSFGKNDLVRGISIGMVSQASILLIFDTIETERAKIYLEFLKSLA